MDWAVARAKDLGLEHFIPPNFAWEEKDSYDGMIEVVTRRVDGERPSQLVNAMKELFQTDKHLLLVAEAGSGKTIASLQIQQLLSSLENGPKVFGDQLRRLVFHFSGTIPLTNLPDPRLVDVLLFALEHQLDDQQWPKGVPRSGYLQELRQALEVAYDESRIIVVIDAFDELTKQSRDRVEKLFGDSRSKVRWLITSRAYSVDLNYNQLFRPDDFLRLKIEPFDELLQNEFMKRAVGLSAEHWRSWLDGPADGWTELLGPPYVLATLARIYKKARGMPLQFTSPSDLFVQYSQMLLARELEKKRHAKYLQEQEIELEDVLLDVEKALGAIALSMALSNHWREVQMTTRTQLTNEIRRLWKEGKKRFICGRRATVRERHWDWIKKFISHFALHQGSTQGEINSRSMSFRSRRIQELWAARYLTTGASDKDFQEIHQQSLGDGEWDNLWKLAIEMPLETNQKPGADQECYLKALKLLFERPRNPRFRRPTELMWEAEQWLLGRNDSTTVKNLHVHLQQQFEEMHQLGTDEQKKAIVELLDPERYVFLECRQGAKLKDDTGEFEMGPDEDDENRSVTVTLSPFALCKYQLTRKQARIWDEGFADNDEVAATLVSWQDCYYLMRMMGGQSLLSPDGQRYHFTLPTEAQWEYACRAGSKDDFCFGNDVDSLWEYAWYSGSTDWITGKAEPQPVGKRRENKWGLHDMHGNVWEWCWDRWGDYEKKPVKDPTGPSQGSIRVYRGGGWDSRAAFCRSAFRRWFIPSFRDNYFGFRVALSSSGIPK